MMLAQLDFSQSVQLEFYKALFTAILVAGAAALVVQWYRSTNDRVLKDRELASIEATKERELLLAAEQAKREVRSQLIHEVSKLGGTIYIRTQEHWRGDQSEEALAATYGQWAVDSQTLENELVFRYGRTSAPVERWHQIRDLMTVRYFDRRKKNTEGLREANARTETEFHSGLQADQLRNMELILTTYHDATKDLVDAIQATDVIV